MINIFGVSQGNAERWCARQRQVTFQGGQNHGQTLFGKLQSSTQGQGLLHQEEYQSRSELHKERRSA